MTDADVLIAAWLLTAIAGIIFVALLYWAIRFIIWFRHRVREQHRRHMSLLGDPFNLRR